MKIRQSSKSRSNFRVALKLMLLFLWAATAKGRNCEDKTIGLENKMIFPDQRFSAKSFYSNYYKPFKARIGSSGRGWMPRTTRDPNDYLEIDLGIKYFICAVATQGDGNYYFTKSYKIMYSLDNKNWITYRENGRDKEFFGNTNGNAAVKRSLTNKPLVRYIRFLPTDFYQYKVLKVGIYGHTVAQGCITNPLGMQSRVIPDSRISASSSNQPASNARLQSAASWCASSSDSSPYLQIDLGSDHVVCAVSTQGDRAADQWVTSYQISTSSDESSWKTYKENNLSRRFYGNYDGSTVVRQILYNSPTLQYVRFQPITYKTTPCLRTEIYGYEIHPTCSKHSVGIPSSKIVPDYRFTASTYYSNSYQPSMGRLGLGKSWRPISSDQNSYLQIDLGDVFYICAVLTQGNGYSSWYKYWVSEYKIAFSDDNKSWRVYSDSSGKEKEFPGNGDKSTVVTNALHKPFRAKFVRVLPTAYKGSPDLRVDFKGSVAACYSPLGLENTDIPNSQMTSSSWSDNSHGASRGRLYGSSAWCSLTSNKAQFIQVDLGQVKTVTGIATQGDPRQKKWVTSYIMTYGFTGRDWYEYKDKQITKVFTGNSNSNNVIVNWLNRPIGARYVRVIPQGSYDGHCLRFDLYGCDYAVSPTAFLDASDVVLPSSTGSSTTLTCTVMGQPSPTIQWFSNGTKIPGQTQRTLQVRFTSAEDVVSKSICTRSDANSRPVVCKTNYTCRAIYPMYVPSAGVGDAVATVTVNLNVPAQPVFHATPHKRSVQLSWSSVTTDDVGKITRYTIELHNKTKYTFHHIRHPSTSYELAYLTPYTRYTIRINVVSTVGVGLWSKPAGVMTLIAEPEGAPSIISVAAESSESMRIKWTFTESNNLNGPLAGFTIFYLAENAHNKMAIPVAGDKTTVLLTSLKKYMKYTITVSVRNTKYQGPESTPVTKRTLQDAPSCSPHLRSVQALTSTSVRVTWDPLPDTHCRNGILKGYKILFRKTTESRPQNTANANQPDISKVIEGLEIFTSYTFTVLGYTIKDGLPSNALLGTTLQDAPTAPRNQEATLFPPQGDMRTPRAQIKWDKPLEVNGIIQRYTLIYQYGNDKSTKRVVNIPNMKSLTFMLNVLGEARLWYKLSASTIKEGPYTSARFLYIPAYPPSVAPRRVRNSKVNETTFKITWQPLLRNESNGVIRSYKIKWILKHIGRKKRMAEGQEFTGTTQENQFLIHNLKLCAQYDIVVSALTGAGEGPNTTISITTSQPGQPLSLRSLESGRTFVYLKWEKPKGITEEIKSYTVEIAGSKPSYWPEYKFSRKDKQDGSYSQLKVVDLYPGTKYDFLVVASTVCGESNKSLPTTVFTDVDKPVRPKGKPVRLKDSYNITLWMVEPTNGPISSYQVIVTISNKKNKTDFPDLVYNHEQAKVKNQNFYITAELTLDELKSRQVFTIGDGKLYGKYKNAPLEKGKTYEIAERAITSYQGRIYTGEAAQVAIIEISPAQTTSSQSEQGSGSEAIIGGVVGVLLIIALLLVIGALVYKKQHDKREEDASLALNDVTSNGGEVELKSQCGEAGRHYENTAGCEKEEESTDNATADNFKEDTIIYENAAREKDASTSMPVRQFVEFMKSLQPTKYAQLEEEFKNMINAPVYPAQEGKDPANKAKNRYANIITYDHSRVFLERSGDEHSDYVNASFINGFDESTRTYIATQGPNPVTYSDFWQMIWEQNTVTIVMLTNLQEGAKIKCHQYWPEVKETYRDITVAVHKTEIFPDYVIRSFLLTKTGSKETRIVNHFQFTVWPDKGVPHFATAVLALRRKVKAINPSNAGPVVVHCSAGVGRTGAYIVIDAMLDRAKSQKNVDISNYVTSIRQARPYMVQTSEQYVFIHLAIYEVLTCGNTEIQACNIRIAMNKLGAVNQQKNTTGYALEYERLNKVTADYTKEECDVGKRKENMAKNRSKDSVALNRSRVLLSRHGASIESNYINASHIDAYKERNAFIVTQAPLQNTIEDFWIMVVNYEIGTIVMLNAPEEKDKHFPRYWPHDGCTSYGQVSVELQDTQTISDVIVSRRLLVSYDSTKQPVNHLQVLDWKDGCAPSSSQTILDLLKEVEQSQRHTKNAPVVVQCNNGVGRSCTFCAIVSIVERAKEEQVIDVFQAVKQIRASRPGAVQTLTQYVSCYEMAQIYLDSFSDYANFAQC